MPRRSAAILLSVAAVLPCGLLAWTPHAIAGATARCGDGDVQLGEQCDDGNTRPDDGCDPDCSLGVNDLFRPPRAGEIYKEYTRYMRLADDTFRVTNENARDQQFLPNPQMSFDIEDLTNAIRAEARVDVWGGHPGTTGKQFRLNENDWIDLPELQTTPTDGQCYTQQWNLTIDVPIEHLVVGENILEGNSGEQTCHSINWGQWGWYSLTVRVFFPAHRPHPTGQITSPLTGDTFGEDPTITVAADSAVGIDRVEVFAYYEGYDTDGDGVYRQYHRRHQRPVYVDDASANGHVGTATSAPYIFEWDTGLVPDQPQGEIKLQARIRDVNGMWYVTEEVIDLTLQRTQSVRLYKPFDVPEKFWIRAGGWKRNFFSIPPEDPVGAVSQAWLAVRTWNGINGAAEPGEDHSTEVNGNTLSQNYGQNHYFSYDVLSFPAFWLQSGSNEVRFRSDSTHHGTETLWPGAGVIARYNQRLPMCGDALVEASEACDAGSANSDLLADACRENCLLASCGDGVVDTGEECDDGNTANTDYCLDTCTLASCGDGVLWIGVEQCDDGNTEDGDGCAPDCGSVFFCGDGVVGGAEECEDLNSDEGDDCLSNCMLATCGDGALRRGHELCDDGNTVSGDGCSSDCQREPLCGDGILDPGEECDDGNTSDDDLCSSDCEIEPFCGDTETDPGEACDDGNNVSGDGCSATCALELYGPNAVINGDYSQGAAGWSLFSNGSANFSVIGGEARVRINTQGSNVQFIQSGLQLDSESLYRVRLRGRNTDGDNVDLRLIDHNPPNANLGLDIEVDLTVLDEDYSFLFQTPDVPIGNARLMFWLAPFDQDGEDYFFDDIVLEKILTECGNNTIDPGEACDDGNLENGDGCSAACLLEATCGDTVVEGAEECDDGNADDTDGCLSTCELATCGDGFLWDGMEECDDGNLVDGDGCDDSCALEPFCGDSVLDPGEDCDDGNADDTDDCLSSCELAGCGDGFLWDGMEQCDDGNLVNGDGCDDACAVEPFCGDGFVDPGEDCDDGNADDTDDCLTSCDAASCGDGFVWTGMEECDDGNLVNGDGCDDACTIEPFCGDGNIDPGETCDDGNMQSDDECLGTCVPASCGDGFTYVGVEECDDGNNVDDDGCSAGCEAEAICGNEVLEPGEECDDGNNVDDDGCSAECDIEHVCGDDLLGPEEQCDDGNTVGGDGCSALCSNEVIGPNLIVNGDFAAGPASWLFNSNGDAQFLVISGEARITIAVQGSNVQLFQSGIALMADSDYVLTFQGRNTGGRNATVRAIQHQSPNGSMGLDSVLDLTQQMQEFSVAFHTPEDDEPNVRMMFWLSPHDLAGATYYFDDVALRHVFSLCGNAVIDDGEDCDDGNVVSGDGCSPACRSEGVCGDGIVSGSEACDDGNDVDLDGCRNDCTPGPGCVDNDADGFGAPGSIVCANGIVEDCDDTDPAVYPGAPQVCDGRNNDCTDPGWPSLVGTDEHDDDADGWSECAGDCADDDGTVVTSPEEVTELSLDLLAGTTQLSWLPQPAAVGSGTTYDVVTGPLGELHEVTLPGGAGLLVSELAATLLDDLRPDPAPGEGFYYLPRAVNTCGVGTFGDSSLDPDPRDDLDAATLSAR